MHLFAIAMGIRGVRAEELQRALLLEGQAFDLDPDTMWLASSPAGRLVAAGVHHGEKAAPRRYVARTAETITLFDGLPVDPSGAHRGNDAAALASGWSTWVEDLEGQFCAVRLDLDRECAEVQLDALGLVPVFLARCEKGVLMSNSVAVIRGLLDLKTPDPLGVSSMIGLGWTSARSTLLDGVIALPGGGRHEVRDGEIATRLWFGTQEARHGTADLGPDELARRMTEMTRSALCDVAPVRCAITAGRDSRMAVALVRAAGPVASYYTIGDPTDLDVVWGQALAERFGLPFESLGLSNSAAVDWTSLAGLLVRQTDGMSDISQVIDYLQPQHPLGGAAELSGIGVKVSGVGGEIGRNGPYDNTITAANLPVLGTISAVQRRVLKMKADACRDLLTPAARDLLDASIASFFDERIAEGWQASEVADLFFTFERIGGHAATAPRRAAAWDDLFSPFCSRLYADYCLRMAPAERYVERPFHQLLARVSPELYRYPYDEQPLSANTRLAGARATRKVARYALSRALSTARPGRETECESPFLASWVERSLPLIRSLFEHDDSPLWELVCRERVQSLLTAEPAQRGSRIDGLLRVATVFWYFHGPATSRSRVVTC